VVGNDNLVKSEVTTLYSPNKSSVKLVGISKNKIIANHNGINICKASNSMTLNDTDECYEPGIEKSESSVEII
jgi:hypothetical protein